MKKENGKKAYFRHNTNGFDEYVFPYDTFSVEEVYNHIVELVKTKYPESNTEIYVYNYTDAVVVKFELDI
jgi:hypothetical protein